MINKYNWRGELAIKDTTKEKKQLVITIEARFDIPGDIRGLEVIGEALEKLQEQGAAAVIDVNVDRIGEK